MHGFGGCAVWGMCILCVAYGVVCILCELGSLLVMEVVCMLCPFINSSCWKTSLQDPSVQGQGQSQHLYKF